MPWPDLTGERAAPASWRAWLDLVWQLPEFSAAVEAASPDLASRMDQIRAGRDVPEPGVRRAVLSTLRYLLRATSRATPFGLFAGVTAAQIAAAPERHARTAPRAVARVSGEWLTGVIEQLEADAELRPLLSVVANDLAVERDGHLLIEHRSSGAAVRPPECVQIRATGPVLSAIDAARCPIQVADLVGKLAASSPDVPIERIDGLIAGMVEHRFLITSLRLPMTSPDPLGGLIDQLEALHVGRRAETTTLRAVRTGLVAHDTAASDVIARDERSRVSGLMAGLHRASGSLLGIDLRVGWDLAIPEAVAAEAASAAGVLACLARHRALSSGWTAWHRRFLERYGPGAVVPVLDAVDAAFGLGYPAGYLGGPPAEPGPITGRDKTLLRLAYSEAARRSGEIVLNDAMVTELAVADDGVPVQPSTELTVRVHAASARALDRGQFTLHVTGVSRTAGATVGRFLSLFDDDERERMSALYAALPGVHRGSLLAQLSTVPLHASAEHIARAPQVTDLVIALGEHRSPAAAQIPVTDLAVTADASRLHLVSVSRRRPVHTLLLNAVDLAYHSHPLARFLVEAPVALAAPCTGFDWGAAAALPFLPALRYGRVIVSPARWILTASDLPGPSAGRSEWDGAFASWAAGARLPRRVLLGEGDQCIGLDLSEPAHRTLLRAHLDRAAKATLRAAPTPRDLGWAGSRVHEIVIPLIAVGPAQDPVRWPGEVTGRDHGHLPGCDGRLSVSLYGPRDWQDAILTRHLQVLLSQLGRQMRWWFIRYKDPADHLRLRLTIPPVNLGPAVEQVTAWTGNLRRAGLIAQASWETYHPETARFGGSAATSLAEEFFAADSAAAVAQLTASARRNAPDARALTAASLVDIAAGLIGDDTTAMRWLISHSRADSTAPPRPLYNQALALAGSPGIPVADGPAVDVGTAAAWRVRRTALAAYRGTLERTGTIRPRDLLPDLLHLHQARMSGPDISEERVSLHLARAAALSRLARAGDTSRS